MDALAYCAGIFDGEGTINIRRFVNRAHPHLRPRHELHVEVNQTRPEAIQFLQATLGGKVRFTPRNGKYSGRWFWVTDSGRAADTLKMLLPYLRIKAAEAELAIRFQATKLRRDTGRSFKEGLTLEEWESREAMYEELRRLKHLHATPEVQESYKSGRP